MSVPFFRPGVDRDRAYVATRDFPEWGDLRSRVEAMWQRYAPICGDNPDHFLNDAACHFHARTWEMYVCCALLDHGFTAKRSFPDGPDLLVENGGRLLWVEGTITEKGTGPDAVRDPPPDGETSVAPDSRDGASAGPRPRSQLGRAAPRLPRVRRKGV